MSNLHVNFFLGSVDTFHNFDKFFGLEGLEDFVQLGLDQVGVDPNVSDPGALVSSFFDDLVNYLLFLRIKSKHMSEKWNQKSWLYRSIQYFAAACQGRHEKSPSEESPNEESPNKESPNEESPNEESPNKESPIEESAKEESPLSPKLE